MTINNRAFADEVRELTNDNVNITVHAGASLYPLPQIKPAVQSGQIQMGEVIQGAMANEDPLFGISMIPFLTRDIEDAKHLWAASRPAIESVMERQGIKLLHGVIWPGQSLLTNRPAESFSDLASTKFRVQSPATGRLAELMGVTGVRVETADIPQAFLTGIIDGMFTSNETTANLTGWDYVDHAYQTNAWYPKNLTFMSLSLWNSLDPEIRKAIETASANAETRGWAMETDKTAEATEKLAENGVRILEPSTVLMTEFQAIGETMLDEWLQITGEQGQAILADYNQRRGM
jgi:TRAP-type C4-dicarboxylate transport system substrate-binding protein